MSDESPDGVWPEDASPGGGWTEDDWGEDGWVEVGWEGADGDDPGWDEPDEVLAMPRQPSIGRRVLWVIGGVIVSLVLVVGASGLWLRSQIDPSGPPGAVVEVEVPEGATLTDLASQLEDVGVVSNATVFRFYAERNGFDEVKAGLYPEMREQSSMGDVIDVLEVGPAAPPPVANVTVPEGLRLTEVTERIATALPEFDEDELSLALVTATSRYRPAGVTTLEGFLYPDTYRIEAGDEADEQKLIDQMTAQFDAVATELGYDQVDPQRAYDFVVMASIIEREARVTEDFGKVSQVIHNRLEQGMPLGVDATLLYAIGHRETLTQSDLETDSPYNTRLYAGLPPTPIAMPGREALEAAIRPEEGSWLYYVLADEDGSHFFTEDYDEFLRVAEESRDQGLFE